MAGQPRVVPTPEECLVPIDERVLGGAVESNTLRVYTVYAREAWHGRQVPTLAEVGAELGLSETSIRQHLRRLRTMGVMGGEYGFQLTIPPRFAIPIDDPDGDLSRVSIRFEPAEPFEQRGALVPHEDEPDVVSEEGEDDSETWEPDPDDESEPVPEDEDWWEDEEEEAESDDGPPF